MRARALKMIYTVACLIAREINFFLIDIVKEVRAWKLQVYASATCTNLQPVTLDSTAAQTDLSHRCVHMPYFKVYE